MIFPTRSIGWFKVAERGVFSGFPSLVTLPKCPPRAHHVSLPQSDIPMSHDEDDFDNEYDFDEADDDSVESQVWQLLRLINPGDDDMALQQFADYREAVAEIDPEDVVPVEVIGRVIDWRSGFIVDEHDLRSLVQAINELASRWNLSIDWNGDPDDDEFFDDIDAAGLFGIAYDRLAEFGYTLWAWETESESHAGWMTLTRDNEPMRELATMLGVNLRLGSEVS